LGSGQHSYEQAALPLVFSAWVTAAYDRIAILRNRAPSDDFAGRFVGDLPMRLR